MNFMKGEYEQIRTYYREDFRSTLKMTAWAFVALLLFGFLGGLLFPNMGSGFVERFTAQIHQSGIVSSDGSIRVSALFANNIRASLYTLIYGLLPFIYLPALALGLNAILLGTLAAYYAHSGTSLAFFLVGVLPHGLFELPALVLSIALGLHLCAKITRTVQHKAHGVVLPAVHNAVCMMLFVCMPLLLVASLVEAYVTPLLLRLF